MTSVATFILCMMIAKRFANRDHPKWGFYGFLLLIPVGIIVNIFVFFTLGFLGLYSPEFGDYSLTSFIFDIILYTIHLIITCILFAFWMMRLGNTPPPSPSPSRKFNRTLKVISAIWIFYGVVLLINYMGRDLKGLNDLFYIELDNYFYVISWSGGLGYLLYLRKRAKLKTLEETLTKDNRSPVIYLRSFKLDDVKYRGSNFRFPRTFQEFFFVYVQPFVGVGFDEYLYPEISKKIGPLITLGRPGDFLPMPGATRIYSSDNDWQKTVSNYIEQSSTIILMESVTEGIKWEIDYIRKNCNPEKLFIMTFPKRFSSKRIGWKDFQKLLNDSGISTPDKDPGPGAVLHFEGNWTAHIVKSGCKNGKQMVEGISQVVKEKALLLN